MEPVITLEDKLYKLLSPSVETLGYELWGIEYITRVTGNALRIYIDSKQGISIDDCVSVSNQVSAILDVEDPIRRAYELEVSSPGADRRLFKKEQYLAYVGENLDLRLRAPFMGRKKYLARLEKVSGDGLVLEFGSEKHCLPFELLDRVRLQPSNENLWGKL